MSRVFVFLIACGLTIAACAAPAPPPDPVTVQLKWVHQGQFAGFYVAQAQGFYAEENLEVTLMPAGPGIDLIGNVVSGAATFGVASADSILIERARGQPVTAFATTYPINPFILVAFADSGITSPRDFAGRTVSITDGFNDAAQLHGMLTRVGVDPAEVTIVPFPYTYDNFIAGDHDVTVSFAAGSFLELEQAAGGRELTIIWPGDYGVHFYSDTLFATDDTLANHPDLTLRFLRATLRGHRFALENPAAAVDATMAYAAVQDRDLQTRMVAASAPLIYTGQHQIGWMEADVWQAMYDTLAEIGEIDQPIDPAGAYTLEFLRQVYPDAP